MATQVQLRRGTTAEHASFTGVAGEMTIDTDKDVIVVHDGATAGGHPSAASGINPDITKMTGLDGDGISPGGALVADEAEITLATGKTGRGWAMAGDNEEYINFRFTAAGVVTVISNTANAVNTDTDGNLCVYDAGTGIAIKNRLGATKVIRYIVNYS